MFLLKFPPVWVFCVRLLYSSHIACIWHFYVNYVGNTGITSQTRNNLVPPIIGWPNYQGGCGWDSNNRVHLPHLCICHKPGLALPSLLVMAMFCVHWLELRCCVFFIGGIVDHRCANFYFHYNFFSFCSCCQSTLAECGDHTARGESWIWCLLHKRRIDWVFVAYHPEANISSLWRMIFNNIYIIQ